MFQGYDEFQFSKIASHPEPLVFGVIIICLNVADSSTTKAVCVSVPCLILTVILFFD